MIVRPKTSIGATDLRAVDLQTLSATKKPVISVIAPCFNEAPCLEELTRRLDTVLSRMVETYEIILIENGSSDGSWEVIQALSEKYRWLRSVRLSRNFGYQGAIEAGLRAARGSWVVVIDGDLQDPPETIPHLWERAKAGYDVVYGIRRKRKEGFVLVLAFRLYYRLLARLSKVKMPLDASEFCIFSERVAHAICSCSETNRSQRSLRAWVGFTQTGVEYERDARYGGESKFSLLGYLSFAIESIAAFSALPLRLISASGFFCCLLSVVGALIYATGKITGAIKFPVGLATLYVIVPLFFGFSMLAIGVVGEYVARVYDEVKARPNFIVADEIPARAAPAEHVEARSR